MKKIITSLLVVIFLSVGYWYFFLKNTNTSTNPVIQTINNFFPSTSKTNTNFVGTTDTQNNNQDNTTGADGLIKIGTLQQLTKSPIAGFTAYSIKKTLAELSDQATNTNTTGSFAFNSYVRYVARGNGYVYEIKNGTTPVQVSNVYIPNIYEAYFSDNNKTAILRFLRDDKKTIASYTVPIPDQNSDGTRSQLEGSFLADNITSFVVSPDQKNIAVLTQKQSNGVVSTMTSLGTSKIDLINNPFSEWNISWPSINTLYLQTKAAGSVNGFLYKVDRKDIRLKKVLGDIPGLTTSVSPSGRYVLYSQSIVGGFVTKILDTQTNQRSSLTLPILPEKCVWDSTQNIYCAGTSSPDEMTYPDAWYAGLIHFNDKLVKINVSNNNQLIVLYDGTDQRLDAINLVLDESIGYLYFINKSDGTLWKISTLN